jgi:hypothetical protein
MVREAGETISGMEGSDDPLQTGHVICGNEFVHGELVKILNRSTSRATVPSRPPSSSSGIG